MATVKWDVQVTDSQLPDAGFVVTGSPTRTLTNIINRFKSILAGATFGAVLIKAIVDEAAATVTATAGASLGGTDVAGVAINGVAATVTYGSGGLTTQNLFMTGLRNKINAGGNTPDALVSKAVYATRTFTPGVGTFTMASVAAGAASVVVEGTTVNFTAVGTNATDALACATAINADGVAGLKVRASASGAVCTVTAEATPRATVTISGADTGDIVGVLLGVTPTLSIPVSVVYASSDTQTATNLAAAINASAAYTYVRATSAAGVVTVISRTAGDLLPAIGVTGTGVTLGGLIDPSCTLTVSTASGTIVVYVNGRAISIPLVASASDTADAIQIAAALNADPYFKSLAVAATLSAGVVTISALSAITINEIDSDDPGVVAISGAAAAQGTVLTGAGTWGGIAGNAITISTATGGITADPAGDLTTGATQVTITSSQPGVPGNWIASAASGAAAANITVATARLTGGAETGTSMLFPA